MEGYRWMDGCGRNKRESGEVRSILKVLRGGNTKTTLTGSPRYYWVVDAVNLLIISLGGDIVGVRFEIDLKIAQRKPA